MQPPPPSRRMPASQSGPSTRRIGAPAAPASRRMPAAAAPASRRMPAAAPQSGSTRSLQRPGAAPPPQPQGRGGPPTKKDNTPMIIGGVGVGILLLVGLGFAMLGSKEPPKKKEPPKAAPVAPAPAAKPYDPWDDPKMQGSLTEDAKRRKAGLNDQNKSGEVDHKDGK